MIQNDPKSMLSWALCYFVPECQLLLKHPEAVAGVSIANVVRVLGV